MRDERKKMRHPIQPVGYDGKGVLRFKENRIVRRLLDAGPFDLNQIAYWVARGEVNKEDEIQLAQLIGYSLDGFGSLSYVDNEIYETAKAMVNEGTSELKARLQYLEGLVAMLKKMLREPLAELYECSPDDLMELYE